MEGTAHKISPEQTKGPRAQALLFPWPTGLEGHDITEGAKLCSQQLMSKWLLVPEPCSEPEDPGLSCVLSTPGAGKGVGGEATVDS